MPLPKHIHDDPEVKKLLDFHYSTEPTEPSKKEITNLQRKRDNQKFSAIKRAYKAGKLTDEDSRELLNAKDKAEKLKASYLWKKLNSKGEYKKHFKK